MSPSMFAKLKWKDCGHHAAGGGGGLGGGGGQRLIVHKSSRSIVSGGPPVARADVVPMDRTGRARPLHFHSSQLVPLGGRRHLGPGSFWPLQHDPSSQSELKTNSLGLGNGRRFAVKQKEEGCVWVWR